jgi:hypothetical protein
MTTAHPQWRNSETWLLVRRTVSALVALNSMHVIAGFVHVCVDVYIHKCSVSTKGHKLGA